MKTIGLLGGMSWESTELYYRLINQGIKARLGGLHSARIALVSVDFQEIEELQRTGDWEQSGAALAQTARQVQAAGADFLLLCTNTMHKVAPQIEAAIDIPFLHLADATAQRIRAEGLHTVGLLGTAFYDGAGLLPGKAGASRAGGSGPAGGGPADSAPRHLRRAGAGRGQPSFAPSTCASSTPWSPAAHRASSRAAPRSVCSCSRSTRTRPSSIRPPSTPRLR